MELSRARRKPSVTTAGSPSPTRSVGTVKRDSEPVSALSGTWADFWRIASLRGASVVRPTEASGGIAWRSRADPGRSRLLRERHCRPPSIPDCACGPGTSSLPGQTIAVYAVAALPALSRRSKGNHSTGTLLMTKAQSSATVPAGKCSSFSKKLEHASRMTAGSTAQAALCNWSPSKRVETRVAE